MSRRMLRLSLIAALIVPLAACALHAPPLPDHPCPLIVAHRGSSRTAPENTLSAYWLAWEQGAHAAETDVRLTADGHVVCLHDDTLERTAGVDRPLSEMTLAEVRALDAGSWKSPDFAGEPVPLLSEVLAITPPGALFFVEIKTGPESVPAIVDVIENSGIEDQIVVIAFNSDVLDAVQDLMPEMPLLWLLGAPKDPETDEPLPIDPDKARIAAESGYTGINVSFYGVHEALVRACEEHGMDLAVWTVDDPERAAGFVDMGICGITTNVPDVMLEALAPLPSAM
ncbi:glycerophosphodiester phosphodiesterase [Candidatus Sumerlaeota bacterium]|nr:glycerophosphodiester phosphodiesterase [Candidatus Sumerlaeota bacterium]